MALTPPVLKLRLVQRVAVDRGARNPRTPLHRLIGRAQNRFMLGRVIEMAEFALRAPRHSIGDALDQCPDHPGLYAVYGTERAWAELGLQQPPADGPLYVGKAEDSLVLRDMHTHFQTGKTGSSTLRRSLAALLRTELKLQAVPRNTSNPGHFAHFAVAPDGDARLTAWMHERLEIAFWQKVAGYELADVETGVVAHWSPPLNSAKNPNAAAHLRLARKVMADEARLWSP